MKVQLLKDVLVSPVEVGMSGDIHELPDVTAKAYIKRKLAKEVGKEGEATTKPADPNKRQTKPAKDAPETK